VNHVAYRLVYLFVCLLPMAGRTVGEIKTKLGIGTHVDPGSVLVKVKVKVMWCHLVNANLRTEARKGRENSSAKRGKYGRQQSVQRDKSPAGGRVLTASVEYNVGHNFH